MVSCGISTHFYVLSPSGRQVTHALLTRPPLSTRHFGRSLRVELPARLACVRHAASVRPEPGSNSLVYCYITLTKKSYILISRSLILLFKLRLRSDILLTDISVFIQNYSEFFSQRIFKPALFIFQGSGRSHLRAEFYYTTLSILCQDFFETFFCKAPLKTDSLFRISHPSPFVNPLFSPFFKFLLQYILSEQF